MTAESSPTGSGRTGGEAEGIVRGLTRSALKATLATLDRNGGFPYASLVAVATSADGRPLLLLSGLAEHTKNINADQRASLLFDGTGPGRAALTGSRVTLVGRISPAAAPTDRDRYLRRHPDAAQFIDFGDFSLLSLDVEWAHMVAGFGRIVRLEPDRVICQISDASDLVAAEASIIAHMNEDHPDAVAAMASMAVGIGADGGQMIGCDPDGIDLLHEGRPLRIDFSQRITTLAQVRKVLAEMTRQARTGGS